MPARLPSTSQPAPRRHPAERALLAERLAPAQLDREERLRSRFEWGLSSLAALRCVLLSHLVDRGRPDQVEFPAGAGRVAVEVEAGQKRPSRRNTCCPNFLNAWGGPPCRFAHRLGHPDARTAAKVSAKQPEGADDDYSDADQRTDYGASLNEHCAIDSRFQRGELSPQFGDTEVEPLRRDMLAMLGGLTDGIGQCVGVTTVDAGVGQLPSDGE